MELLATRAHKENFSVVSTLFRKKMLLSTFAESHFGAQVAQVMLFAQTHVPKGSILQTLQVGSGFQLWF